MLWSKENPVRFLVLSEDTLIEQIIEEATNHLLLQEYGIEQDPPLLYINPLEDEDESGAITLLIDEYDGEVISYRIDPNLLKKDKIFPFRVYDAGLPFLLTELTTIEFNESAGEPTLIISGLSFLLSFVPDITNIIFLSDCNSSRAAAS